MEPEKKEPMDHRLLLFDVELDPDPDRRIYGETPIQRSR